MSSATLSGDARQRWISYGLVAAALLALAIPSMLGGPLAWLPLLLVLTVAAARREIVAAITIAVLGTFVLFGNSLAGPSHDGMPVWAAALLLMLWLLAVATLRPLTASAAPQPVADDGLDPDAPEPTESFRDIIEHADNVTLVLDDAARIRYANRAAAQLLGNDGRALHGEDPAQLAHPEDAPRLREVIARCVREPGAGLSIPRLRLRAGDEDGSWVWLDARISGVSDAAGTDLVLTARDITAQVQAENALRRSETRFESLFEASRDALVISRAADGVAIGFNEAFVHLTGWTREDGIGDLTANLLRLAADQDLHTFTERLEGDGQVADFETELVTRDGRVREVSISGRYGEIDGALCVVTIIHDISETRRTEAALSASEEKFSRVFNRSPDAMCITRLADRVIIDINDRFEELLQGDRADIVGRAVPFFADYVEPELLGRHDGVLERGEDARYDDLATELDLPSGPVPVLISTTLAEINDEPCAISLIKDMRALRRAQQLVEESEARFRGAFEEAPIGMLLLRPDDDSITQVNRVLCELLGMGPDELIGMRAEELMAEPDRASYRAARADMLAGRGADDHVESRFIRSDGSELWASRHMVVQRGPDGSPLLMILQLADITEMKENRERMERLAFYDTLTDLANRRLFNDRLEQVVKHAVRSGEPAALMYLDLDNFKRVNDTLGHEAGDELLRSVAERLRRCVRAEDTVGRSGGDEFTVLLGHVRDARAAGRVARKIINALDEPIQVGSHEFRVTTSIGVTVTPDDGVDPQTLMKNADLAMYRAKERGRDNYQFFSDDMNTRAMERLVVENELRTALQQEQFELFYQPKVHLDSGVVVGMEALVRWRHPTRGLLAPDAFIQVAEESGLIVALGKWTLREACRQARELHARVPDPVHVAVNISARQFADPGLPELVSDALASADLGAEWLELEITETMLMLDVEDAIVTLGKLRGLGLSLSIDDFGTGYSSLNYLKRLPINNVKVDRSFVSDIPDNADDMAITAAVVAMAHQLNLKVVAEGIETDAQLQFLRNQECEFGQGYLFGPPLPFDRIATLIIEGTPMSIPPGK